MLSKIGKITVISISLVLMIALPVLACGGHQANFIFNVLNIHIFSALSGYGLPLLAMLGIESWLLGKKENLPYWKSFLITLCANMAYLFLGVFTNWFWTAPLPFPFMASAICAVLFLTFCQRQGVWKNLNKSIYTFIVFLQWSAVGVGSSFLMENFTRSTPQPMLLLYLMTSVFILIGFLVGFVIKGSTIAFFLRPKHPTFANTIMSMHICSYVIVPFAYLILRPY